MPLPSHDIIGGLTARAGVARAGATRTGCIHRTSEVDTIDVAGDYIWNDVSDGGKQQLDSGTTWTDTET